MILKKYSLSLVIIVIFGCSKVEFVPQSFSQKMIGKWELRERVDLLHNKNGDWFTLNPPFFTAILNEDKTYSYNRDTFILETGTYSISDLDSIVQFNILRWQPTSCTNNSFILIDTGREGEVKGKYFKVE